MGQWGGGEGMCEVVKGVSRGVDNLGGLGYGLTKVGLEGAVGFLLRETVFCIVFRYIWLGLLLG